MTILYKHRNWTVCSITDLNLDSSGGLVADSSKRLSALHLRCLGAMPSIRRNNLNFKNSPAH